jgi:hypothetical protein
MTGKRKLLAKGTGRYLGISGRLRQALGGMIAPSCESLPKDARTRPPGTASPPAAFSYAA